VAAKSWIVSPIGSLLRWATRLRISFCAILFVCPPADTSGHRDVPGQSVAPFCAVSAATNSPRLAHRWLAAGGVAVPL